jgi:hypothetical protein
VAEYHRDTDRKADYGIDKHDWRVGNCRVDSRTPAHQKSDNNQNSGKSDKPCKENG